MPPVEGATALELSEKANPRREETAAYIAIRVRFLDDFAIRLIGEGIRQVVIPAAGMDARSLRLDWPAGTTVYEIDHAELLARKAEILNRQAAEPKCRRIVVGTDLERDWVAPLQEAGFSPTEPSIWIVEGLLYYLTEEAVHRFLQQVSELAETGSGLGADLVSGATLTSPRLQAALQAMEKGGFGWKFGTDEPEGLLDRYGWETVARQLGEEGTSFGRWRSPVVARDQREVPRTFLVAARKG